MDDECDCGCCVPENEHFCFWQEDGKCRECGQQWEERPIETAPEPGKSAAIRNGVTTYWTTIKRDRPIVDVQVNDRL